MIIFLTVLMFIDMLIVQVSFMVLGLILLGWFYHPSISYKKEIVFNKKVNVSFLDLLDPQLNLENERN